MDDHNQRNYYEILEVPVDATPDEIYQGHMRAKNAYSQDSLALYSLMSQEECQNILQLIDEAYSILSDPLKRRQYDQARGLNSGSEHPPLYGSTRQDESLQSADHVINQAPQSTGKNNMNKIVIMKKFALEYEKDPEFEQEIEQAQEYTGELIKRIREYKNMDLVRLAELTRISKTYLANIEAEKFDNLPAPVYVRGFVYQVAKCLKLNPDFVATSYVYRMKKLKEQND